MSCTAEAVDAGSVDTCDAASVLAGVAATGVSAPAGNEIASRRVIGG